MTLTAIIDRQHARFSALALENGAAPPDAPAGAPAEGAPAETPADGLADDALAAAFDKISADLDAAERDDPPAPPPPTGNGTDPAAQPAGEPAAAGEGDQTADQDAPGEEPFAGWSETERAAMAALPRETQSLIADKLGAAEARVAEAVQTNAVKAAEYRDLDALLDPLRGDMAAAGQTPAQVFARVMGALQAAQDPRTAPQVVLQLAAMHGGDASQVLRQAAQLGGLTLDGVSAGTEDGFADPLVSQLQSQVTQLTTAVNALSGARAQDLQGSTEAAIAGWLDATDAASGAALRPEARKYVPELRAEALAVRSLEPALGLEATLSKAWDRLQRTHPTLAAARDKRLLADEGQRREAEARKAAAAGAANVSGSGQGGVRRPPTDPTAAGMDATLAAIADKHYSG